MNMIDYIYDNKMEGHRSFRIGCVAFDAKCLSNVSFSFKGNTACLFTCLIDACTQVQGTHPYRQFFLGKPKNLSMYPSDSIFFLQS